MASLSKPIRDVVQRVRNSLARQGIRVTIRKLYALVFDYWFDFRFGIDTCTWIPVEKLDVSDEDKRLGNRYQPTRIVPLRQLLTRLEPMLPSESVLVDLGSGKGRVLLIAAEFGFEAVKGVEFSKDLCRIARANLERYVSKTGIGTPIEIHEGDVRDYRIGERDKVFFLFNPFGGAVLDKVLANLAGSLAEHPRKAILIYNNPAHGPAIERSGIFRKAEEIEIDGSRFTLYLHET